MTGLLQGKTALVTGAARGIGRATAILFAREGARVAVSDMSEEATRETVAAITATGGEAIAVAADVTKGAEVDALVARAVAAFGRLDCAFNNAGIAAYQVGAGGKRTADWPEEAVDRMLEVNLKGVWLAMRAELHQMVRQGGGGTIVNTASIAGLVGLPTSSAYVAAKHGVIGFTKSAAIEYARDGIRVNAVCPGYIETDMTRDAMARRGDEILATVPFKRMGTAQEIAEMVCWLCSDRASFVSGAAYNVDGGFVAG
jgi:NAD(P)-dependent dehydrogenase (short-subunit alcohol dehydrogenase family)